MVSPRNPSLLKLIRYDLLSPSLLQTNAFFAYCKRQRRHCKISQKWDLFKKWNTPLQARLLKWGSFIHWKAPSFLCLVTYTTHNARHLAALLQHILFEWKPVKLNRYLPLWIYHLPLKVVHQSSHGSQKTIFVFDYGVTDFGGTKCASFILH